MLFRPANRADVPAIVALLADDVLGRDREADDPAAYFAAFDAIAAEPDNHLIVAEHEGLVVACCQLTFITGLALNAARRAQVEGVRVAESLRGTGLGESMIAHVEARARAAGCSVIQLTTNRTRADAQRFYERLGFTPSHIGYKKSL